MLACLPRETGPQVKCKELSPGEPWGVSLGLECWNAKKERTDGRKRKEDDWMGG